MSKHTIESVFWPEQYFHISNRKRNVLHHSELHARLIRYLLMWNLFSWFCSSCSFVCLTHSWWGASDEDDADHHYIIAAFPPLRDKLVRPHMRNGLESYPTTSEPVHWSAEGATREKQRRSSETNVRAARVKVTTKRKIRQKSFITVWINSQRLRGQHHHLKVNDSYISH